MRSVANVASPKLSFSQRLASISLLVVFAVCAIVTRSLGPEALLARLLLVAFPASVVALAWSLAKHASTEWFPTPTSTSILGRGLSRLGFPKPVTTHIAWMMVVAWPLTRRLMLPEGVSDFWTVGCLAWWMASAAFIAFGIPRFVGAPADVQANP